VLILGIDFETTGTDPQNHQVIEVGMQLWDWELGVPINEMGYLVNHENFVWDEEFKPKSKITQEMCQRYGISSKNGLKRIQMMMASTEVVCAHNGNNFDKLFLEAWKVREKAEAQPELLWIDTQTDIDLAEGQSRRLLYMAADHGLCPHKAHRALADVNTMMEILRHHDINHVLEVARTPTITIQALVAYDDREKAKALGYHAEYESGKFKYWIKTIKQFNLEREREAARPIFELAIVDNYRRK